MFSPLTRGELQGIPVDEDVSPPGAPFIKARWIDANTLGLTPTLDAHDADGSSLTGLVFIALAVSLTPMADGAGGRELLALPGVQIVDVTPEQGQEGAELPELTFAADRKATIQFYGVASDNVKDKG